jgi:hypothetical protein
VQLEPLPASAYFWFGLAGIIASGFMLALGSDYWALAGELSFAPYPYRLVLLLAALVVLVAVFDLCALGVIFVGGVTIVQRLRGRI